MIQRSTLRRENEMSLEECPYCGKRITDLYDAWAEGHGYASFFKEGGGDALVDNQNS
jgi:hypothetical protein